MKNFSEKTARNFQAQCLLWLLLCEQKQRPGSRVRAPSFEAAKRPTRYGCHPPSRGGAGFGKGGSGGNTVSGPASSACQPTDFEDYNLEEKIHVAQFLRAFFFFANCFISQTKPQHFTGKA